MKRACCFTNFKLSRAHAYIFIIFYQNLRLLLNLSTNITMITHHITHHHTSYAHHHTFHHIFMRFMLQIGGFMLNFITFNLKSNRFMLRIRGFMTFYVNLTTRLPTYMHTYISPPKGGNVCMHVGRWAGCGGNPLISAPKIQAAKPSQT